MREYKMRRGETLDERAPDLKGLIEEYFGPVSGTEDYEGHELYVIEDPSSPAFERIVAGAMRYDNRKDKLAVHFEETEVEHLIEAGQVDAAETALSMKNEFLKEVTGRDAKARRESMKRAVEDEPSDELPGD